MIGPRTLEGGYSPSQKVSSANRAVDSCCLIKAGATFIWLTGVTKAWERATARQRTTKLSLDMLIIAVCFVGNPKVKRQRR